MKKTVVAIIGCGNIGSNAHLPSYAKNSSVEVKYLVDIDYDRAKKLADEYGVPNVITDYKDILKDNDVEAVSICTPNYLHAPMTIDFLNAGKHVLCEKPASIDYENVLEMKEAADKNNKILNIGVVNRFDTSVNKIRDIILSGELGNIYHVYCSFRSHRGIPGLGGWFTTKSMSGGGVLIDWGIHFFDLILYSLGTPKLESVSANAYCALGKNLKDYSFVDMWAGPPSYDGTYDVDDFVTGLIRTQTATINFNGAWAQNIDENAMFIDFLGDKGGIKLKYGGGFTIYSASKGVLYKTEPTFKCEEKFECEINEFIESVNSNIKNQANIDNVLISSQLLDAIYKSSENKKEVIL